MTFSTHEILESYVEDLRPRTKLDIPDLLGVDRHSDDNRFNYQSLAGYVFTKHERSRADYHKIWRNRPSTKNRLNNNYRKLSKEDRAKIRKLYADGYKPKLIAESISASINQVRKVLKYKPKKLCISNC